MKHTFFVMVLNAVKNYVLLLFLVSLSLFLTLEVVYADSPIRIEVYPRTVKQGAVCLIRATVPGSPQSVEGLFQGKKVSMDLCNPDGIYDGLIGIDMSTPPGRYEIKVVGKLQSGKVFTRGLSMKVEKALFGVQRLSLPSDQVDLDPQTLERVHREDKKLKSIFEISQKERIWRGAFIRPIQGEISSPFGVKRIINGREKSPHTGIDLEAQEGTPVLACNSGVVVLVEDLFFSGNSVILDHGWDVYSMYFHLSESLVKEGERVSTGTTLGRVGSTGRSTKAHLHWGVRINGARVDPLSLLSLSSHL